MAKEQLPIYKIEDFNSRKKNAKFFYLCRLAEHLQEHKFIQRPHKHDFYIVMLVTRGTGIHTIDFRDYAVQAGIVFFLTPGQVHSWQLSDDADGFILFFTQEYYLERKKLYQYPYFATLSDNTPLPVSEAEQEQLLQIQNHMQQEYQHQLVMKDDVLRDYLDILLVKLLRTYNAQGYSTASSPAALPELLQLQRLIDLHYKEHQPVSFYAEILHTSAKHLNEVCKKSLGKTTTQLIQERLVLEAKRLLIHSALSIKQVAAEIGFFEVSYFFRFFKKHTGQTPEQFRQEQSIG
ncbi:AraC family transcriptional regulator [Pontibacter sp. H249]|uniref:AraC family transcriptional regulator n=1 Tax=Pontibacter sp. H249 TaxID=3133420 RepID=UPI0030C256CB